MQQVEGGHDICAVQGLPGHADLSTTLSYADVLNRGR
jgi:site-specific recombinase XerD